MLSDFGWKLYFGREENKENLINLLNSLLEGEHVVEDLSYSNVEEDGDLPYDRKVIFDRGVSYTSRTISRLTKKATAGNNYELPPVYFIAVLGFRLDPLNRAKYYYSAKIFDELDQEVLYPKLSYKMFVLPNFIKPLSRLDTIIDQWMYLMKHLDELDGSPKYLDKRMLSRIFIRLNNMYKADERSLNFFRIEI
ncbi:PD-(D/E)XK nuclease family transposase [Sphingobacterium multivorum]|uniref:PD-(D/E)XK nuclease family transposase n=2 Tax=Sphingobacterium TaxID=28453 RepID=A0ACD5C7B7_9SPHI|nr:PD-(D/E)XK nuclease family transposase [Sphingobacterium multivorum]QRQ59651.1 PD-(D/E)XK nuclease family transposase [Sphingobacterium multivorum]SPZ84960.1 PD-(D/E)XK nuclease family transposase [Sphingobacterium multivorum]